MKNMKNMKNVILNFIKSSDGWIFMKSIAAFGIFLVAVFLVVGFVSKDDKVKDETTVLISPSQVMLYNYDGCEYIKWRGMGNTIIHKGNCSNHIHSVENSK